MDHVRIFVSKATVKALNLPTTKHTNPYKLGWVRKGIESKVIELCRVPLSIGNVYAEEITVMSSTSIHVIYFLDILGNMIEILFIGEKKRPACSFGMAVK